MALQSFYEDIVIDTPEAAARLEAIIEEHPIVKVDEDINIIFADEETIHRFMEKHIQNGDGIDQ